MLETPYNTPGIDAWSLPRALSFHEIASDAPG
jgi:hypothetical protein